ncbi:MAG: hypothetical protein GWP91_19635 [Rhodobacterales bacterium]|nr:hypothetical protein [Rhodobacterales bacterium]
MNADVLETLAWMLLHSLWQAAVIAVFVATVSSAIHSPRWRHNLAMGGLLGTALWTGYSAFAGATILQVGPLAMPDGTTALHPPTVAAVVETAARSSWAIALVQAWFLGAVISLVLVLRDAVAVRGLRHRADVPGLPDSVRNMVKRSSKRMGVAEVMVRLSNDVGAPTVTGVWRPMILLPATALGLTPDQLETVILHELAHVKRHDLLIAIEVRAMHVLYFFNPAVWWLEHRIRTERELCCDDLVVASKVESTVYARALLALAEQRTLGLSLAATVGNLRQRIERLAGLTPRRRRAHPLTALMVALGLLLVGPSSVADPGAPSLGQQLEDAAVNSDFDALRKLTARATKEGTVAEKWTAYAYSGEYWFGAGDAQKALDWYELALALPLDESDLSFARYKAGWSHYNLKHADAAIDYLKRVSESGNATMETEAFKDLVRFYVDFNREAEGKAWYKAHGQMDVWNQRIQERREALEKRNNTK